mmetsp:Transcript_30937/g.38264  ORF Transcript_30937/g.38264 Transcript_30937/m.38264 type:complete len:250 (-) Transcript_30937:2103-2852(-)
MAHHASGIKRQNITAKHIKVMVQSARTIYFLAKTQNPHLMKRLYDLQIIDYALETYQRYSKTTITGAKLEGMARTGKPEDDAPCEMLILYCKLILLEMSHDTTRQQEIIMKNEVRILETLANFNTKVQQDLYEAYLKQHMDQFLSIEYQKKSLQNMFKETTLRFCIETKNILYASLVPFLVTEIFNRLETLEAQKPGQQVVENRLAGISQDASDDSVDEEDPDADMTAINGTMSRTLNMSSLSVSMSQA